MDHKGRIRVLVVDDSAFARKVIRQVISRDPAFEVVDIARDGLEALEKIGQLAPDVVTLDLVMPDLDGLGVLRALPAEGAPRVVVVSFSDADTELGAEALQAGVVGLVKKPTSLATDRMYELAEPLLAALRAAVGARPLREVPSVAAPIRLARAAGPLAVDLVAVGTSTGGPQALTHLVSQLPADLPVPVVIALHIPAGYTEPLAHRLDGTCALRVVEASDGLVLVPGQVALAPGGKQTRVVHEGGALIVRIDARAGAHVYSPSVDLLFGSAAQATGGRILAVVLTGMGDDGVEGARQVVKQGGRVIHEDESSCVIYGMPRSVAEAGLSKKSAPIQQMAALIAEQIH
jgi:two-component system, chemotaxis family, protein-glutamate methylesterase/glutaminase